MCVHPDGEEASCRQDEPRGGRTVPSPMGKPPCRPQSNAGRVARPGTERDWAPKRSGPISLCRGARLGAAVSSGARRSGSKRIGPQARGDGGSPPRACSLPTKLRGGQRSRTGSGRGSSGPGRRATREAPAHTREGLWREGRPGRATRRGPSFMARSPGGGPGSPRRGRSLPCRREPGRRTRRRGRWKPPRRSPGRRPSDAGALRPYSAQPSSPSDGGPASGLEPSPSFAREGRLRLSGVAFRAPSSSPPSSPQR
jgi:hypothetical protein